MKQFLGATTILFLIAGALTACSALSNTETVDEPDWITHYEYSGHKATPRYEETVSYCKRLAAGSPWIEYTTFGTTPQGRSLPLLIVNRKGRFSPTAARQSGNAVVLIQACIHAGEADGKDAGLMLIRDAVIHNKMPELFDHVTLLFIPIFNVDGHERFGPYNRINQNGPEEMGWRVTAQNYNLNRDFLKADSPEMVAWLDLFTEWLPEFFVDCHVTDGADYQYALTYGLELLGNMEEGLTEWTRDTYLTSLENAMDSSGFPIYPYVILRTRHQPQSGLRSWVAYPRLSQGYTALHNRPGLLVESHMLKDYKTRVTATYEILKHTLAIVNKEHKTLKQAVRAADDYTTLPEFRMEPYPLTFQATSDSIMIDFLGIDYTTTKSDLTGRDWVQFGSKPVTFTIPYFNEQVPRVSVTLPEAYIIPPEWDEVIRRLEIHGIEYAILADSVSIEVSSYRFENVRWNRRPYEGRFPLQFETESILERRLYPAGSAVVDMHQRAARVAAHILEPQAPDSYIYWGFFNSIFEQKEYTEDYVMEKMAREMLEADPELKKEYEEKMATDEEFAKSSWGILNWFYQRTVYWDDRKDVYPVGRIVERDIIGGLPLSD